VVIQLHRELLPSPTMDQASKPEGEGFSLANILGDSAAFEKAQTAAKDSSDDVDEVENTAEEGFCIECEGASGRDL
jgi:hypothetical protein